jgi:hypothetical protein
MSAQVRPDSEVNHYNQEFDGCICNANLFSTSLDFWLQPELIRLMS